MCAYLQQMQHAFGTLPTQHMWDLTMREEGRRLYLDLVRGDERIEYLVGESAGNCTRFYIDERANKLYAIVDGVLYEYALRSAPSPSKRVVCAR